MTRSSPTQCGSEKRPLIMRGLTRFLGALELVHASEPLRNQYFKRAAEQALTGLDMVRRGYR